MRAFFTLLPVLILLAACYDQAAGGAGPRAQIRVVGSSTVYPFTAIVAERLVASNPSLATPVIESTGTGAGMRLFCSGIGARHADAADASRRMSADEYRRCAVNGAGELLELQIGLDGVALVEALDGPGLSLTAADLYRALAAMPFGRPNRAQTWADVNPALPSIPIKVYGPPATSGTRDALTQLILRRGCQQVDPSSPEPRLDPATREARCTRLREDGAFIDAGENDNLIVRKLRADPGAIGVLGYGYLEENRSAVRGIALDGVFPTYRSIAAGRYPGSRPLFLYVKRAHLGAVPGLRTFLRLYAEAAQPGGALVRRGLIAAPAAIRRRTAVTVAHERPLDPATLS